MLFAAENLSADMFGRGLTMGFASPAETKSRLLVVDDELLIASLVRKRLEAMGYSVIDTVPSGEEAIVRARETQPDLVLMDIGLKGKMDGVEAVEKIRAMMDIPVIYLTAYTDPETLSRAKVTEPFGYIIKPFQDHTLKSTIEMALYRHRMEKKLKMSEQWLATTLSSIGDAVITTDAAGMVTFMNPAAELLTGWRREEAHGLPLAEVSQITGHEEGLHIEDVVADVIASNSDTFLPGHVSLVTRKGGSVPVEARATPISGHDGTGAGLVLVFRDISGKRKMEEALLNARKLESIGDLAGGIAHDFNNLLTAILGNISLSRMYVSEDDKVFRRMVEAEKACLRARDLTRQLLTFARGGAPVKKNINITDIIKESVDSALSASRTVCRYDIPGDMWLVTADAGQIKDALGNLILNADQAMPDGGVIEVSCGNLHPGVEGPLSLQDRPHVRISIRDHGTGVPREYLSRIFDPYFTTKEGGKGLGLTTAYSIIRNHSGHITVDSAPDGGAVFSIYLPAAESGIAGNVVESAPGPATREKILLMDDEENIRAVAAEILKFMGYDVESAVDGAEAVEKYKSAKESGEAFSVVIMDLTISEGMGGNEAVKILREIDPGIKAIVSSGYSNDPIMADYKSFGFSGIIAKPYKVQELRNVLENVLGG
jgi:two-component system cell cycle sensor histidine kinase/response regulator CckA